MSGWEMISLSKSYPTKLAFWGRRPRPPKVAGKCACDSLSWQAKPGVRQGIISLTFRSEKLIVTAELETERANNPIVPIGITFSAKVNWN